MSKLTDELEALVKRYSWNEHQPFFDDGQAHAFGRAMQLAREHEAETGWRPIAEAPKDGSEQVLGGELMGRWSMWLAWWTGGEDEPEWRCSYTGECIPEQYKATHYLPSPPPPETKP